MEDVAGTRALAALQASSEVRVTGAHDLLRDTLLSFEALDVAWVLQQETNASTSAVVASAIALANSSLANCNSIRSADKYASL